MPDLAMVLCQYKNNLHPQETINRCEEVWPLGINTNQETHPRQPCILPSLSRWITEYTWLPVLPTQKIFWAIGRTADH